MSREKTSYSSSLSTIADTGRELRIKDVIRLVVETDFSKSSVVVLVATSFHRSHNNVYVFLILDVAYRLYVLQTMDLIPPFL
jgi:hypothetical protein